MSNINQGPNSEEVKSEFINIASHQLKTPIAGVRWSLDALLSSKTGKLSKKQKDLIQEAYKNNQTILQTVNDLLRISRIEEQGVRPVIQASNVADIVKEIAKRAKFFAKAYNCTISLNVDKNLPPAYVDPIQLKPVIEGLIDNSIRYGKNNGLIKVSLRKEQDELIVEVKDNGIGIPSAEQKNLFTKFFRAGNAMRMQPDGLGLDLFLAKKVIDAMGGKISFESQDGRGSAFWLHLPINKKEIINESAPKGKSAPVEDILKKEREFVSITVHELKAPLGITKWSLETLKSGRTGKLNDDQVELVNQVYRGNERLLVLVRDLLDLAKLQEGKFDVLAKPVELGVIIKDVIIGFKIEAEKKKIKMGLPDSTQLLPPVNGDANRIAQVVTNLVSNAIKYTPEGGNVAVAIRQASGEELKKIGKGLATAQINNTGNKKGYLILSVTDTGVGISEEEQKKLFTRFFRGKRVLESKTEGTGLGLYITKTIVELHRGDIWFTSRPGQGSIFYFSLPIA
jgi:signal transduction histidine kinase